MSNNYRRHMNGNVPLIQPQQRVSIGIEYHENPGIIPTLATPTQIVAGNKVMVLGGMTKRLAVAAPIYAALLREHFLEKASAGGPLPDGKIHWVDFCARSALSAADALIAMELQDRIDAKAAETPETPETPAPDAN